MLKKLNREEKIRMVGGLVFGVVALSIINKKDRLKVKSFAEHTIADGETMEAILLKHNPSLSVSPSVMKDLASKVELLNPHAKQHINNVRIQVPIFKL